MSIQAEDLANYVPAFGWEMAPPSEKQTAALEKWGILPDAIETAGKATKLLERLEKRRDAGLTTPKQIRCLEKYGFLHVGTWSFEAASRYDNPNFGSRMAEHPKRRKPCHLCAAGPCAAYGYLRVSVLSGNNVDRIRRWMLSAPAVVPIRNGWLLAWP